MKSVYSKNVFSDIFFEQLKSFCLSALEGDHVFYSEELGRYHSFVFLPETLSNEIIKKSSYYLGVDDLDVVYAQVVKYQIKDGSIPRLEMHKDNLYCTYTVDISIDSNLEWPLIVGENLYPGEPNSVVFLKGDEELHGRPEFPSKSTESFVTVLFVHIAPEGDKYLEMSRKLKDLPIEKKYMLLDKMTPIIDVNYYRNNRR